MSTLPAMAILVFIIVCRIDTRVADFYSLHIYPLVSGIFSFATSFIPFSFNDMAIVCMIVAAIAILLFSIKKRKRWYWCLVKELKLVLWVFVWFYIGWCTNYFRSDIFTRTGTPACSYDEQAFTGFLDRFTASLNDSYTASAEGSPDPEKSIKDFYSKVPRQYGLCKPKAWQKPKPMLARRFQSATGITGYMGPLGGEFHINSDVLPDSFPFTYAHEYSHLMGVSNEAEANWWAYKACLASDEPQIRYSGYYCILSYVWDNARRLLDKEAFEAWKSTIKPEIIDSLMSESEYWDKKRITVLDKAQSAIYDLFLKSNKIGSGTRNYSEVVMMIISLEDQ